MRGRRQWEETMVNAIVLQEQKTVAACDERETRVGLCWAYDGQGNLNGLLQPERDKDRNKVERIKFYIKLVLRISLTQRAVLR